MNGLQFGFYDGKEKLEITIESYQQLTQLYFPEIIEFFSESEGSQFDIYIEQENKLLLQLTIRKMISVEQLLQIGAAFYALK